MRQLLHAVDPTNMSSVRTRVGKPGLNPAISLALVRQRERPLASIVPRSTVIGTYVYTVKAGLNL